jgi:hypothetical protein
MKTYLLTMYQPEGRPSDDVLRPIMEKMAELREELQAKGQWVFGNGLTPTSSATVVKVTDGEVLVTDGPFLEAKVHMGGITIITAADLDEALAWARRYSEATGLAMEVRPFFG